jgi:ABC-2 type transport system permease protein
MPEFLTSFVTIIGALAVFGCLWYLLVRGLMTWKRAAYAVLRRNFVSYFSNPTGYAFICVFVLSGSFAAFWPNEFFNSNLANLDQLNNYLPWVMLVFIPAITMSLWADERRQGTDELLLTIPAADTDVVLGKYLAAVAIFTVALMFSLFSNYFVLGVLGNPDIGLFVATYVGYWFMGLAMLAIGMVASFLTGNLTVGFILGAVFNLPLVFASYAEVIVSTSDLANSIRRWSLSERFIDFGRGVLSLSSVLYFVAIAAAMFYLSVVLIGRRHWMGGKQGSTQAWHYMIRCAAIFVGVIGLNVLAQAYDRRQDVTEAKLTALSDTTRKLVKELDRPVRIDAYISPTVPKEYVQTRLDLLAKLRELDALGGEKVDVHVYDTERFSENAELARDRHGIESQRVMSQERGSISVEEIYLGVAFTSGLEKVKVPFFDRGLPVEYELIRSIATVSQQKRKRLGVLMTDAQLFGTFNQMTFSMSENEPIISELEKQYEVVRVNPDEVIPDDLDVLLAVQPSAMSPEGMQNLINAVRNGMPTAIFEDPMPRLMQAPGTGAPRMPDGGMNPFAQQQQAQPKGNIQELWDLLGVEFDEKAIAWQDYNPYRKFGEFPREFVFVDESQSEVGRAFSEEDPIAQGLQQVLFIFPGAIRQRTSSDLQFEKLIVTGSRTGTVDVDSLTSGSPFGPAPQPEYRKTGDEFVLGAHIRGKAKPVAVPMYADDPAAPAEEAEAPKAETSDAAKPETAETAETPKRTRDEMNVVLVTDIDILSRAIFELRAQGSETGSGVNFEFDNVTFVLNVLDALAGDDRFVDIRKRRAEYRTLQAIEEQSGEFLDKTIDEVQKFKEDFNASVKAEQDNLNAQVQKIQRDKNLDDRQRAMMMDQLQVAGNRRVLAKTEELKRVRDENIEQAERSAQLEINRIQNRYKLLAVTLPAIPPLVVGLIVFFSRRAREREGVSRNRLRMT